MIFAAVAGKLPSAPIGVVIVGAILIAVSLPIARRLGATEGDPRLVTLLMIGLILHFLAAPAQIFVDNHAYHGVADFSGYVHQGAELSVNFRSFHFTTAGAGLRSALGDGSVSIAAGIIFSLVGVNELATFWVFAWFSWLGAIFFYRAFCLTFPEGEHRRYALMLFLLPSLLFWTSDVSKEAVMMLALGITSLGGARVSPDGLAASPSSPSARPWGSSPGPTSTPSCSGPSPSPCSSGRAPPPVGPGSCVVPAPSSSSPSSWPSRPSSPRSSSTATPERSRP